MSKVDEAIKILRQRSATLRCSELEALLREVGLDVAPGRRGKHRIVDHPMITEIASDFDGGHGADAQVKSVYTSKMRKLLETYQDQLEEYLESK